MKFEDLNLVDELIQAINRLGFVDAMPIQEQVIPFVINETKDLVALAQTGTGKTAAFGIPLLQLVERSKNNFVQALVLAPTRELCVQIADDLRDLGSFLEKIEIAAVYGGEDIRKQLKVLDKKPQLVVATPGRLIDLMRREKINLNRLKFLVLDEADEMLNMGFKDEIETILKETPTNRRTMLFSATMPDGIRSITARYLVDPVEIAVGERNAGTANVKHVFYRAKARNRYLVLKRIVDFNPDIYGIVFCRTRQETKDVAEKLMADGYNADALHGDLSQVQRDTVMQKFRMRNLQLLVATDVAARGLDVEDLSHVINYNLPDDVEVYTHRSGRTGRANKSGVSLSIIHSKENFKIKAIEKSIKQKFERNDIPGGLEICKKQLFWQINRMQHVDINEEQIAPYIDQISKQLEYLTKEELLKRFVSIEFNRFLDYYKDAEDLNVQGKESDDRGGFEKRRKKGGKQVRLKIDVGSNDGMTPARLLGLINHTTKDKTISVGEIEIVKNFSFFAVYEDQLPKIKVAFEKNGELKLDFVKGKRQFRGERSDVLKEERLTRRALSEARHTRSQVKNNSRKAGDKPWRRGRR